MKATVRNADGVDTGFSDLGGTLVLAFDGEANEFACVPVVLGERLSALAVEFAEWNEAEGEPGRRFTADVDQGTGRLVIPPDCGPADRRLLTDFNRDVAPEVIAWLEAVADRDRRRIRQIQAFSMPPGEIGGGALVPWGRVFREERPPEERFHPSFEVTADGNTWLIEDDWCLNPDCDRLEVVLRGRRRSGEPGDPEEPDLFVVAATLEGERAATIDSALPDAAVRRILAAWREQYPGLADTLIDRHLEMKDVGWRLLVRAGLRHPDDHWIDSDPRRDDLPGRRGRCPCESGRRFEEDPRHRYRERL